MNMIHQSDDFTTAQQFDMTGWWTETRREHFLKASSASGNQAAHFFHSLPSGGFTSTGAFLTSSQLVLRVVPPLST